LLVGALVLYVAKRIKDMPPAPENRLVQSLDAIAHNGYAWIVLFALIIFGVPITMSLVSPLPASAVSTPTADDIAAAVAKQIPSSQPATEASQHEIEVATASVRAELNQAIKESDELRRQMATISVPRPAPPQPIYLADAGVIEAQPPMPGKVLVLTGRINEDINGKVAVYVDYGQQRVSLGEISGTKNEKRELSFIETNIENNPNLRALYWGDPTNKRFFPTEPSPIQPIAVCIVLKGDKGDQQVPIGLLRIQTPYDGQEVRRLWIGFESPCKRAS
jgi:hypothetical protein